MKNGNETDIDCGGTCGVKCDKERCTNNTDCRSGVCGPRRVCLGQCCDKYTTTSIGINLAPSCDDGVKNGNEGGIDCGGSCSLKCDGQACLLDQECQNNYCARQNDPTGTCQSM